MQSKNLPATITPIDVKKEVSKLYRNQNRIKKEKSPFFKETDNGFQSSFFDPYSTTENYYGKLKTADGFFNREVDCQTLRRVSKKASIINLCILNIQRKIKPYLKPSTNRNFRGFIIHKKGEEIAKTDTKKTKEIEQIENFLLNTGFEEDSDRDDFLKFCLKIIRDVLEIDQVSTEIGFTKAGEPYAFWAIDGATIERVLPNQDNPHNIKFIQVIDSIPQAFFPEGSLIFDYQNPRSDIYRSFYGYSYVEQAIDLITSQINAFSYNAGFFTENKLPRGMLLLNGNANQETVEQMEDYLCDIMSGSSQNQWRVPIVPAGSGKSGDNASSISWVNLNGSNSEMQFQAWLDFLTSEIISLFGCSVDELGLQINKSQAVIEHNTTPAITESKSQILGEMLTFLQRYINKILVKVFPDYELEFVGYERDDPKALLDIAKDELSSFKVLNEIRKEKGLPKIEADWADKCPANPQLVQMYQSSQMNEQQGGGMEDMGDMDGEEDGGDFGSEEETSENIDNEAWNEVEENSTIENENENEVKELQAEDNSNDVEKSLLKQKSKRKLQGFYL